jgi:hypothetical protein
VAELSIDTTNDPATVKLARALIVCEICAQIATVYVVFDMVEHGALNVKLAWCWKQWKARYESERQFRNDLRYALWQAKKVLEESHG